MVTWDVFHSDRLELERGLDAASIRAALARGELRDDDLVRPAGTAVPWSRIDEVPELIAPAAPGPATPPGAAGPGRAAQADFEEVRPRLEEIIHPPPTPTRHPTELPAGTSSSDVTIPVYEERLQPPAPPGLGPTPPAQETAGWLWDDEDEEESDEEEGDEPVILEDQEDIEILADDELPAAPPGRVQDEDEDEAAAVPGPRVPTNVRPSWEPGEHDLEFDNRPEGRSSHVALPVVHSRDRDADVVPDDEEDPDASFSLSRSATAKVEELDLAPMVDVAFNLVLFFMVTATTVLYKTLEIPKPNADAPAGAVAQGRNRTMDELKDDYILIEIDDRGAMKFDHEPIEPTMANLVELLRRSREKTGRKAMLLSADFLTPHRNAVLAYDAANEIGMGIALAKPQAPLGPAPALRPAAAAAPKRAAEPAAGGPS